MSYIEQKGTRDDALAEVYKMRDDVIDEAHTILGVAATAANPLVPLTDFVSQIANCNAIIKAYENAQAGEGDEAEQPEARLI